MLLVTQAMSTEVSPAQLPELNEKAVGVVLSKNVASS